MEVHTHPHTDRKKFTHYLWEFLMLFLAVFCGFLAENIREKQVEHHREKEYMRSLIQDLQEDTRDIDRTLELGSVVTEKLDSFIYILDEKDPDENAYDLYRLGSIAGRIIRVSFNDRTSSQLKYAGTMRLIRSSDLSDSIQSYWTLVKIAESIAQRMEDIQSKAGDISVQMIRYKYFGRANSANPFAASLSKDAKLINSDPKLIAQLSNHCRTRLVVLYNYIINIKETKAMALRLVDLLKKEYHLK
jgi:hypothetical protein